MAQTNEIIESFLGHYKQGYYFYDKLATLVADQCEKNVNESSIRAIVTSRAKKIKSLKEKIYQRHKTKNYQSETAIFEDIVDLAGVRIALYFPADRKRVENFIKDIFIIVEENPFPRPKTENEKDKDKNKFDGYHADHYRVMLKPETLDDNNKDCANSIVEIQVASILMHAWAEVNHDLAYKPSSGELSKQETSILDGLNGLVLTGEVLLKQLQYAFQERVAHQKEPFANEYELAAFIYQNLRGNYAQKLVHGHANMGNINSLFRFLQKASLNTPEAIYTLLNGLDENIGELFIANQMIESALERNIQLINGYCDMFILGFDTPYLADDSKRESVEKLLKLQFCLKRYLHCLLYYKNIVYYGFLPQDKKLRSIENHVFFHNTYRLVKKSSDFLCGFWFELEEYSKLSKDIETVIEKLDRSSDLDVQKAMEWARSGQLELPKK